MMLHTFFKVKPNAVVEDLLKKLPGMKETELNEVKYSNKKVSSQTSRAADEPGSRASAAYSMSSWLITPPTSPSR